MAIFHKQQEQALEDAAPRAAEIGRIRLGQKVTKTGRNGEYTAPEKLREFRFTSSHRQAIDDLAAKYGGEVMECADIALQGQWEVITEVTQITAIMMLDDELSQWMEFYNKKDGCIRRCNKIRFCDPSQDFGPRMPSNPIKQALPLPGEYDCLCARLRSEAAAGGPEFDESKQACKPVTRLAVILPGVTGVGVWRMDTKSVYACYEMAEQLDFIKRLLPKEMVEAEETRTDKDGVVSKVKVQKEKFLIPWIPITLTIDVRRDKIKQGDKTIDTEFIVPVINTPFSTSDLVSGQLAARIQEFSLSLGTSAPALSTGAPALAQSATQSIAVAEVVEAHVVDDEPAAAQVVSEEPMTPNKAYGILGVTAENVGDLKAALKQTGVDVNFGDFAKVRAESGDKSPDEFLQAIKMLNPGAFEVAVVEAVAVPNPPPGDPDHDPFAAKVEQEGLGGLV